MGWDKWHHQAVVDMGQMASSNSETPRVQRALGLRSGKTKRAGKARDVSVLEERGGVKELIYRDACVK